MACVLYIPLTCYGAEYAMEVDFSPNIINIESERLGEIRVFTDMRYSTFVAEDNSVFIYFNDARESVPNIRATRDSLGNLILKFNLVDLLTLTDYLDVDDFNSADVVVVMKNGDQYSGGDDEVYLADKKGS
jgi:hypothetical protein